MGSAQGKVLDGKEREIRDAKNARTKARNAARKKHRKDHPEDAGKHLNKLSDFGG